MGTPARPRIRRIALCVAVLSLGVAGSLGATLLSSPHVPPSNDDEVVVEVEDVGELVAGSVQRRQVAIRAALPSLVDHEWAGEYHEGDGLGSNISILISPVEGVSVVATGCFGVYGANEGEVAPQRDGSLSLYYSQPNPPGPGRFPVRLVPVRWGERRFLVPREDIGRFADMVNDGDADEFVLGLTTLVRAGDEDKPLTGAPTLPSEYARLVRAEPATFAITQVAFDRTAQGYSNTCSRVYRIGFDAAHDAQLHVGSRVFATASGASYPARVTSLDDSGAVAELFVKEHDCTVATIVPDRNWTLRTATAADRPRAQPGCGNGGAAGKGCS